MRIANIHTTIDYKKLIENQANMNVCKNYQKYNFKVKSQSQKIKLLKRTTHK